MLSSVLGEEMMSTIKNLVTLKGVNIVSSVFYAERISAVKI